MFRYLIVVAIACAACADREPASRADLDESTNADSIARVEIREQGRRWIEAAEAEDAATVAAIYTEDAHFLPPDAPVLTGRDTIRSLFEAQFEAMDAEYDFSIEETEVAGEWAWRRGGYVVEARVADGDTLRVDDKFVDIWRRGEDGRWRIAVDIWNANPPPGETPR